MERENHRKFLDEFALKFGIKENKEWSNITVENFSKNGGSSILRIYGGSLFNTLQKVYPGSFFRFNDEVYK
jgi:hypothetical protein